jgi:uncharacterized membrane protein YqhA
MKTIDSDSFSSGSLEAGESIDITSTEISGQTENDLLSLKDKLLGAGVGLSLSTILMLLDVLKTSEVTQNSILGTGLMALIFFIGAIMANAKATKNPEEEQ